MRVCTGFHPSRKSRPISNQATEQMVPVILPIKERRDFLHDRSPHHLDNQLIHILCRFSGRKKLVTKSKKRFPHQPRLVRGQLNHSFLCFTAEHLQHLHSSLPSLYPQMRIMANVQMRIFRKANKEEEFQYVKGEYEAIVPESLWNQCAEIRNQKSASRIDANGRMQKFGSQEPQGVWKQKLRCSCGSSFRKYLWHKNANGTKTYGYECYRQKRNVSAAFLKRNHLDVKNVCQTKSIPAWQLDLMAKKVFSYVWKDQKDAVLLACKMLEECSRQEKNSENAVADSILKRMGMLEKKLEGLREMRALGDITREAFLIDKQKVEEECKKLKIQLHDLEQTEQGKKNNELDINAIRQTLNRWIDTSTLTISEELVDEFVLQIVVVDDQTFNWTLDLTAPNQTRAKRMKPSEIALLQYREKQTGCDSQLDTRITDPQMLLGFSITEAEAEEYCHAIGMKFFRKKWEDKTVIISI